MKILNNINWDVGCDQFPEYDRNALLDILDRYKPKKICEIGCWSGSSTRTFCEYCELESAEIVCIDNFKGSKGTSLEDFTKEYNIKEIFLNNINRSGFDKYVTLINEDSSVAFNRFDNNYFDLIFIDGDHSYSQVYKDLENWYPKTNNVMCGHDFDSFKYDEEFVNVDFMYGCHNGVVKAVTEKFKNIEKISNLWCIDRNNQL